MNIMNSPLSNHLNLTPRHQKALENLGIRTVRDLLYHFPFRYQTFNEEKLIADLVVGEEATIRGRVIHAEAEKTWKRKINIAKTVVSDGSASIRVVWFNQPYMARILSGTQEHTFSGKVQKDKKGLYMANPKHESGFSFMQKKTPQEIIPSGDTKKLFPVYAETRGISSLWISNAIRKIFQSIEKGVISITDPIPKDIRKQFHLPDITKAFFAVHLPQYAKHAEAARKRFAFEEIFFIQLVRQKERLIRKNLNSFAILSPEIKLDHFLTTLPFTLTDAQRRAIYTIMDDFKKSSPMARLLEGDVGSGKTAVAAAAIHTILDAGYQTTFMAPTEILARQHYQEFQKLFRNRRVRIGLITSSECRKFPSKIRTDQDTHISRSQLLRWIASGEIDILMGTHALIQDMVRFKNLAFVVIDEQHRFGIKQRARLVRNQESRIRNQEKNKEKTVIHNSKFIIPHLLSMTATPIPRTLALTMYGDLDLTLIDEMPPGRKKVKTFVVPPEKRKGAYEFMRKEISDGKQAYVVCPRIEEKSTSNNPLFLDMKSVKAEHKKLTEHIFPEWNVGMLHGQMLPKEKEKIMDEFRKGKIHLLVATSVIEVGVNVPNATMIMIEGAERFGLAQLHQLRGRVIRSTHQPYCFIFTDSNSQKTQDRLNALVNAKNGFELAEYDLQFRGAGELTGTNQWGMSDVAMEALKNIKMVEAARSEAQRILTNDLELKKYPLLKEKLESLEESLLHFE